MAELKWKDIADGGAELKTGALRLVVSAHEDGGWRCVIYNAGRYRRLYQSEMPIPGDLAYVKGVCVTLACLVLRDETLALEAVR